MNTDRLTLLSALTSSDLSSTVQTFEVEFHWDFLPLRLLFLNLIQVHGFTIMSLKMALKSFNVKLGEDCVVFLTYDSKKTM